MLDEQSCPWCHSEKFIINFDEVFERKGKNNLKSGRVKIGVSSSNEVTGLNVIKEEDEEKDDAQPF